MKTREIKFRGQMLNTQIWVYGYLYEDETGSYIKESKENKRFGTGFEVDPKSVGQYTGLKDKNGNEIYEGDIMKFPFYSQAFEIVWNNDGCYYEGIYHDGSDDFAMCKSEAEASEVIGKIYENPELLTNQKT